MAEPVRVQHWHSLHSFCYLYNSMRGGNSYSLLLSVVQWRLQLVVKAGLTWQQVPCLVRVPLLHFLLFQKVEIDKASFDHPVLGYMSIASCALFLLTGALGFHACFWFVRKIYSALKKDWLLVPVETRGFDFQYSMNEYRPVDQTWEAVVEELSSHF